MGFDRDLFVRRMLGHRDFWACAVEHRELFPKSALPHPAAIHDEDLSDVTGVAPGIPLAPRLAYMQEGIKEWEATTVHRFRNLRISQGSIYSDSGHIQLRKHQPHTFGRETPEVIDRPVALSCNRPSTSVYGHFAVEQMTRELMAEDMGLPAVTLPSLKPFWHEEQLRGALGLGAQKLDSAVLDDGWVFIDRPKNHYFAERFERIRARLGARPTPGDKLVYLRRGDTAAEKREIRNQDAFEEALAALGFETIEATNPDLEQIAETLSQARITCTIEGSQAAHHFLYAPRGAALLVLMPSDRFNHIWKEVGDLLDMPFGFVLGQVTGAQEYDYPVAKLETVLNRLEGRIG